MKKIKNFIKKKRGCSFEDLRTLVIKIRNAHKTPDPNARKAMFHLMLIELKAFCPMSIRKHIFDLQKKTFSPQ